MKRLEFYTTLASDPTDEALIKGPSDFKRLRPELDQSLALTAVTPRSEAMTGTGHGWKQHGWVTGHKKRLKNSEQYPKAFSVALAKVVLKSLSSSDFEVTHFNKMPRR